MMSNWNGEYKVKCPKCGCRKIWATEHTDAISEHLIDNGEWLHEYDNNDYGIILYTDFCCNDCGHKWRKNLWTIESLLKENKPKRKRKSNVSFIEQVKRLKEFADSLKK